MVLTFKTFGLSTLTAHYRRLSNNHVLILHADEWRAQSTGYAGDRNVKVPNLDRLAASSANFALAVSGLPVCTPYRASLLTGRRPLSTGIFMNDVLLDTNATMLCCRLVLIRF